MAVLAQPRPQDAVGERRHGTSVSFRRPRQGVFHVRPDPDAALELMVDAMVAGQAEAQRLMAPYFDVVGVEYPPETRARLRALTDEYHTLRKRLAATPATGPAGHRAKARAAMLWLEPGGPEDAPGPDCDEHLVWSLARDVLALGGAA